jgi:hypothetical protein
MHPNVEMSHDLRVRWSKLIEIQDNSRLLLHNRLFTNWFSSRQKLLTQGESVVTHRIASKRIVLEVTGVQPQLKGRRLRSSNRRLLIASMFTIPLVLFAANGLDKNQKVESKGTAIAGTTFCGSLKSQTPFEVEDFSDFDFAGWNVRTLDEPTLIGAVGSIAFEAKCEDQISAGVVTFSKTETDYTILRLATD